MLLMKVPQPLQQPMLLYKPLESFLDFYIQQTLNRFCQLYRMFWRLYYISFEIFFPLSQMGISRNFILFPSLSDMIIWSCTYFSIFRPRIQQTLKNYHGLYKKYQRAYYSSFEIYFHYLKWVFLGIWFRSMVWEICSIKATYVCKIVHMRLLRFNKNFLILWNTIEKLCHKDGKVSFISQMGLWHNSISSPAT